jgi:hypothetical protein
MGIRLGRDRMVVGFTTTYTIPVSTYHHWSWEFEPRSGEVYSIQHYVIKFVSYLRQVGSFIWALRFPPPIKVALSTINQTNQTINDEYGVFRVCFRYWSLFSSFHNNIKQLISSYCTDWRAHVRYDISNRYSIFIVDGFAMLLTMMFLINWSSLYLYLCFLFSICWRVE